MKRTFDSISTHAKMCTIYACKKNAIGDMARCPYHIWRNRAYSAKTRPIYQDAIKNLLIIIKDLPSIEAHAVALQHTNRIETARTSYMIRKARTYKKKSSSGGKSLGHSTSQEDSSCQQVVRTQSESLVRRQRVSSSESKVERERRPDGTVLETEVSRTHTREIETEIKRVCKVAYEEYETRKTKEVYAWTDTIRNEEGWKSLKNKMMQRYPTTRPAFSGGVFKWHDVPIEECMNKHRTSLAAIMAVANDNKPVVITVWSKAAWLKTICEAMSVVYPDAAYAFRVMGNIFEGAGKIKSDDIRHQDIYEKCRLNSTLPAMETYVPTLSKDPSVTSLKVRRCVKVRCGAPIPLISWTSQELLIASNAWQVYSSYENKIAPCRRSYMHLSNYIASIAEFVENFLVGNTMQLFNHMLGVQLSRRLLNDLQDAPTGEDFTDVYISSQDGLWNSQTAMQGNNTLPFYHPDRNINTSWVTICATYRDHGRYELIFPGFVAMNIFGEAVFMWHRQQYAPAVAKYHMEHRDVTYAEEDDGFVDDKLVLGHVYQSQEFSPVRALKLQEEKILRDEEKKLAGVNQNPPLDTTNALNKMRGVGSWGEARLPSFPFA
jgi:hypothetical protein